MCSVKDPALRIMNVCVQVYCQFNILQDFHGFTLVNSGKADSCWGMSL